MRLTKLPFFNSKVVFPWTNVYGLARSLIALGTFLVLAFNDVDTLIQPTGIEPSAFAFTSFLQSLSLFSLLSGPLLVFARFFALAILFIVIIGYRPQITGILHWYVTASFSNSALLINGGDQIAAVLTLLLIPITLFDTRKWHWSTPSVDVNSLRTKIFAVISCSCFYVIKIQMFVIYFMAGVAKLGVEEWVSGTAMYYWFNHSSVGLVDWMYPIFKPLITTGFFVSLITWSAILIELLLAGGLIIKEKYKKPLLFLGIAFHFFIAITMGLINFFFVMSAGLFLYLLPVGATLDFSTIKSVFKRTKQKDDAFLASASK